MCSFIQRSVLPTVFVTHVCGSDENQIFVALEFNLLCIVLAAFIDSRTVKVNDTCPDSLSFLPECNNRSRYRGREEKMG